MKTTAGRKSLPAGQKKTPVTIYLKLDEIAYLGGMETVKRYLTWSAKDRIERKQKNDF